MGSGERLAMPRFLRETSREREAVNTPTAPATPPAADASSDSSPSSGDAAVAEEELTMSEELQRRKTTFLAHFKSSSGTGGSSGATDDTSTGGASQSSWASSFLSSQRSSEAPRTSEAAASPADYKCHVCNASLRLPRVRHRCRNCNLPVCGVHSKNQVPLPHLGIMREVRVCDLCTRQLVQRRAGYRSPKKLRSSSTANGFTDGEGEPELSPLTSERASLLSLPSSPDGDTLGAGLQSSSGDTLTGLSSPNTAMVASARSSLGGSFLGGSSGVSSGVSALLPSSMPGILYSCLLEEQDNTMDEILYLGTFTMGGRSLASRRMSANVALWKYRMFLLTPAEMLCFKATGGALGNGDEDSATAAANASSNAAGTALGEVRSSVHLSDILHIEVNDQFPRILTVIRSDGRVFRVRARTAEQCAEIAAALRKAMQEFQDALYKLQRGPQPEDNSISCVTLQHESSLPETVVVSNPAVGQSFQVAMYPSSILRLYVNGPMANGTALYSCEMLTNGPVARPVVVEAEPLASGPREERVLHVSVRSENADGHPDAAEESNRRFWGLTSFVAAMAAVMNSLDKAPLELLAWLSALVLFLTRFHEHISLLLTTRRFSRAQRLHVTCVELTMGKSDEPAESELVGDDELDTRFLEGCNGEVEEAKRRYVDTMAWRKENDVDTILLRPCPVYTDMKECFTHFIHKRDRRGHPVTFEFLGGQRKALHDFTARGVTEDEAIMHHVRIMEFLWKVMDPRPFPDGNKLMIYDIKGICMADLSSDVVNYTKKWGEVIATYNPERVYQVFIVNPPSWFNLIWKLVSPLINPKTRERVHVLRGQKDISKALLEFIAPENLPKEYGGECSCEGGCFTHSPEEIDLAEWTEFINKRNGTPDDPVVMEAYAKMQRKYLKQLEPYGSDSVDSADMSPKPATSS